jgi:hypothetical protein
METRGYAGKGGDVNGSGTSQESRFIILFINLGKP